MKRGSSLDDLVGRYSSLPDASFISGDTFNHLVAAGGATPTLTIDAPAAATVADDGGDPVKDKSHSFDLDITDKGWMIGRGFLSLPTMNYESRIGALEARDVRANPNPLADEGNVGVPVGGTFHGNVDFAGDTDDIRVFLVAGQTYLVSLQGSGATPVSDTFLEVYSPTATLVNFDDDGGIGTNSFLTLTAATTGNYIIRASSFSNPGSPGTGGYDVDVRVQGVDAVGDTNATAVVLNQGTTFGFRETATVSGGNDLDRYEVQLEAGKYYTFKLAAGADYASDYTALPAGEIDTILRLRNAAGTLIAQNDDNNFPTDISSGFGFLAQTTGTYYLDVTGYSGQTGGYVIDFQNVVYQNEDPLEAIRWKDADNIDTVLVDGKPTAYVYFGAAGETFGEPDLPNTYGWNAREKAAVFDALKEYTKITGITYLETTDVNQAEFRLQTVTGPNPPVSYGAYFYPQDPSYGTQEGIGVFNVNSGGWDKPGASTQDIPGDQVSLNKGGFSYAVILHEFGHAHGLAHPHDNGGGSDVLLGVTSAQGSYGIFNLNQGVYTVMSYNDAWDFHPDGPSPFTIAGISQGWSGTLGAFDIAVLQERYGVHEYATGDDTYVISATQANTYYQTIWDTGGNDTIAYSGTGNATIDLTAATLDYSPTGAGVLSFVDQIPGTAGADGIFGGYTIAHGVVIENATGGDGNDMLIGNEANNVITGGGGVDTMIGRGGNDRYYVDNTGDVIIEGSGNGLDTVLTTASYTLSDDIERLAVVDATSTTDLSLAGNRRDNEVSGNAGNNFINGGAGADYMFGYGGNDIYIVDNAGDLVIENAGEGLDTVFTSVNYTLLHDVERVGVNGFYTTYAINLTGNELGNEIWGNNGANVLDGKAGADVMYGYGGNDTYIVDNAGDIVIEVSGADGTDTVLTTVSYTLGNDIENLRVNGQNTTNAIDLTGNAGANQLFGNDGDNVLSGLGGSDVMFGGGGADKFVFASSIYVGAVDQVLDFQAGVDKIVLSSGEFAGLGAGSLSADAFAVGAAGDANDRIIYDSVTGGLWFDADGNGAGAAVQFAQLGSGLALTANDFTVI